MNDYIKFKNDLIALEDSMYAYARRLTANDDDALDLVQDTFLKALIYKDRFEPNSNLRAWVFTIMRNIFLNNWRKKVDGKHGSSYSRLMANMPVTPDSQYNHRELCKQIDRLDPTLRIPFRMHVQGYKYSEIAEELNIRLGTVKSRISNSRQQLMKKILRNQ